MPVDKKIITRKISLIQGDIIQLKKISRLSFKDFQENPENEILAERYLERIIGRMIDINYHLITEAGHPAPRDYYFSFIELGKLTSPLRAGAGLNLLPGELSRDLAQFAGLRNVLAHEYNSIDNRKVWRGMKLLLKLLPQYLKGVSRVFKK